MTAKRLELGARARSDPAEIWTYADENWGRAQAEVYSDGLNLAMLAIASGSRIGRRAEIAGFLKLRVGSHAIYYRKRSNLIQVVRILHPRQNIRRQLRR